MKRKVHAFKSMGYIANEDADKLELKALSLDECMIFIKNKMYKELTEKGYYVYRGISVRLEEEMETEGYRYVCTARAPFVGKKKVLELPKHPDLKFSAL